MFSIRKIDHVAVCVEDLDRSLATFRALFGLEGHSREASAALATEAVFLDVGETAIELVSPHGEGALARSLEKRGPGLHHIALQVERLDDALAFLRAAGVPLIDETPRVGAKGHRIAFLHPKATGGVLVSWWRRHEFADHARHTAALLQAASGGEEPGRLLQHVEPRVR